jgi:hypothetical protein
MPNSVTILAPVAAQPQLLSSDLEAQNQAQALTTATKPTKALLAAKPTAKGKAAACYQQDTLEVMTQDKILPCLNERICHNLLNREKDGYKVANWKPVVRFAQDLEAELNNMLENPQQLSRLTPEAVTELQNTLTKIGEGLTWLEGKRRNWFKDMFAPFFDGYDAEVKAFATSYATLNVTLRALNAVKYEKIAQRAR